MTSYILLYPRYLPLVDSRSLRVTSKPIHNRAYAGCGSDVISQFLSDTINLTSPLFFIMHLGYASRARIRSGYGYNARI